MAVLKYNKAYLKHDENGELVGTVYQFVLTDINKHPNTTRYTSILIAKGESISLEDIIKHEQEYFKQY